MVYDFYGSRYASCLAHLQKMLPVLRLDIFLSSHVDALYEAVRSSASCLPRQLSVRLETAFRFFSHRRDMLSCFLSCAGSLQGPDSVHDTIRVRQSPHNGTGIWNRHRVSSHLDNGSQDEDFASTEGCICCDIFGQFASLRLGCFAGCSRMSLPI